MMKVFSWFFCLFFPLCSFATEDTSLPFNHDLHLTYTEGKNDHTMICFHGLGGDYRIAYRLQKMGVEDSLISFNFPDYGFRLGHYDLEYTSFGSIDEILPVLYILKRVILEEGIEQLSFYGFSAGAGAFINAMGALNTSIHDAELLQLGIGEKEKHDILQAIQKGTIVFDTPLKSIQEIVDFWGRSFQLDVLADRYTLNSFNPIDSLFLLQDLSLNITVHFQDPDEVLTNRDDELFIERLIKVNHKGTTRVIIGQDQGHNAPHPSLWKEWLQCERSQGAK